MGAKLIGVLVGAVLLAAWVALYDRAAEFRGLLIAVTILAVRVR